MINIKKSTLPVIRTPDYEFLAAKVMHVFGGYTVSTLLAEPASTFFILVKMADRAAADTALDAIAAGIGAAIGNSSRGLEQRRAVCSKDTPIKRRYRHLNRIVTIIDLAAEYMRSQQDNNITETIKLDDFKKTIEK